MATKPEKNPDKTPGKDPKAKARVCKKTVSIVGVILALEAVIIIGAFRIIAGPASVDAASIAEKSAVLGDERIIETMVLHAKLPNSRSGITYLYDTEIYVQAQDKHTPRITRELEQFNNEIRAAITAIWRTAEPHHFQEPNLETLTRNVHALLNERFGSDAETGEPIVNKCVIVMGTGFRIDN